MIAYARSHILALANLTRNVIFTSNLPYSKPISLFQETTGVPTKFERIFVGGWRRKRNKPIHNACTGEKGDRVQEKGDMRKKRKKGTREKGTCYFSAASRCTSVRSAVCLSPISFFLCGLCPSASPGGRQASRTVEPACGEISQSGPAGESAEAGVLCVETGIPGEKGDRP